LIAILFPYYIFLTLFTIFPIVSLTGAKSDTQVHLENLKKVTALQDAKCFGGDEFRAQLGAGTENYIV